MRRTRQRLEIAFILCLLANSAAFATVEISLKADFPKYPSGGANEVRTVGNLGYVAIGEGGFAILDITNPANPIRVGGYDTEHYTSGLAVAEPYVYLADHHGGVVVLDVSEPANPFKVGEYNPTNFFASAIAAGNSHLYVSSVRFAEGNPTATRYGLEIIDVSDPANPIAVGSFTTPKWWIGGVELASNNIAYVCLGYNGSMSIDVADPAAPTEIAHVGTSGFAVRLAIAGTAAYIASREAGLQIVDLTNPAAPAPLAHYTTDGEIYDVVVRGGFAYLANLEGKIEVLDVSNPLAPALVGSAATGGTPLALSVAGNNAYVAAGKGGVQVVNVADPAQPDRAGVFATHLYFHDIVVAGDYAYAAAGAEGVQILEIGTTGQPRRLHTISTVGPALALAMAGQYVYVVEGSAGLEVFDVTNRETPVRTAWCASCGPAVAIAVSGDRAYLAGGDSWTNNGLRIIDVRNPAEPIGLGTLIEKGNFQKVVVSGGYAYVVDQEGGLRVIDVSFPLVPDEVSTYDLNPFKCSYGIAVGGRRAFFGADSLSVLDVRDPRDPILLSNTGSYHAPSIALLGHYALLTDYATGAETTGGLRVFQTTNAAVPSQVGQYDAAGFRSLVTAGNSVYVANAAKGLTILDMGPSFATAPSILSHPTDHSVPAGFSVTLQVNASGTLPLAYQWRFNGTNLGGAKSSLLTITNVDSSNEGAYSVQVSNNWGVVQSSEALVKVAQPPVIKSFTPHQTVAAGSDVLLEVIATGIGPFRYKWQFHGTNVQVDTKRDLELNNVQAGDNGSYTVVVDNLAGSQTVSITLTVTSAPPVFVRQPLDKRDVPGARLVLRAEARGSNPLDYQWLRNGARMSGQTNKNLVFDRVRVDDTAIYQLVVSNAHGQTMSNPARLEVQVWPDFSLAVGNMGRGRGNGVAADLEGHVFLTGQRAGGVGSVGTFEGDMFLAKFSPDMELRWITNLGGFLPNGGVGPAVGNKVTVNAQGDAYVTGSILSGVYAPASPLYYHDAFVAKFYGDGRLAWFNTVWGTNSPYVARTNFGSAISVDRAGNIVVVGSFEGFTTFGGGQTLTNAGGADVFLVKYSAEGELLWARRAGGAGTDRGYGLDCDADNNIYLCGIVSFNEDSTIHFGDASISEADVRVTFLAKCDPGGNFVWVTNVLADSPSGTDAAHSLSTDGRGNVHIAGMLRVPALIGNTNLPAAGFESERSAFVAMYGPQGDCIRVLQIPAEHGAAHATVIAVDPSGNFFVGGKFSGEIYFGDVSFPAKGDHRSTFDGWIASYDFAGRSLWARPLGGPFDDALHDVVVDEAGRAYVAGFVTGPAAIGSVDLPGEIAPALYLARIDDATAPTAPRLRVSRSNDVVEVSWPAAAIGFELQSFNWDGTTVPVTPISSSSNGLRRVIRLPITGPTQWFRLTRGETQ